MSNKYREYKQLDLTRIGSEVLEKWQKEYIDFDKVGEMYVDIYGPAQWLAHYDSEDREQRIDGVTYYIYRRQ